VTAELCLGEQMLAQRVPVGLLMGVLGPKCSPGCPAQDESAEVDTSRGLDDLVEREAVERRSVEVGERREHVQGCAGRAAVAADLDRLLAGGVDHDRPCGGAALVELGRKAVLEWCAACAEQAGVAVAGDRVAREDVEEALERRLLQLPLA
jgi:hypothetical protein